MTDSPFKIPKNTTPTWELELLISAASAFALIQLLGVQQETFLKIVVWHNESHMHALLSPLYIYLRIVVLCLSGAFILHLATRAYWVGLIGLNSIYPEGPDLSKFRYGPFQRRHLDANKRDIGSLIEKSDNLASIIFSFGVGLALTMAIPVIVMLITISTSLLLAPYFGYRNASLIALIIVVGPFILLTAIPSLIDQMLGKYIAKDGFFGRVLTKSFDLLHRLSVNASGNALTAFVFSRMKGLKSVAISSAFIGLCLSLIAFIGTPRVIEVGTKVESASGLEASDYLSQREGNLEYANRAFIASPIVSGKYLDLTVPIPGSDIPSDRLICINAKNERERMKCLRLTLSVKIDSKAISVDWLEQRSSPGSTMALRAFIDISGLTPGQHKMTIDYSGNKKAPDDTFREIINFWN